MLTESSSVLTTTICMSPIFPRTMPLVSLRSNT
jgi:hypothetical protein